MVKSYHLSDLKAYRTCPKLFWLKQRVESQPYFSFLQMPMSMKDALIQKVHASDLGLGFRGMTLEDSLDLLEKHEWVFNARFEAEGLRVKVAGLHKVDKGYDLYFTSLSSYPKIEDKTYHSQVLWVLDHCSIPIKSIQVCYLNRDYVRRDTLDMDQCFLLSSHYLKNTGFDQGDILETVRKKSLNLEQDVQQMKGIDEHDVFDWPYDECPLMDKCEHYQTCFPSIELEKGISQSLIQRAENPKPNDPPLQRNEYAQLQAHYQKRRFVDHLALANWFSTHHHDCITFVDFEWDSYGIPPYHSMHPLDVLPFQFSMHIRTQGVLSHKEFLGDGDCREAFIQAFIEACPSEGPILAYNAFGAEVIRLQHLSTQFPQYKEALESLITRFVDLATLFVGGVIYDERMNGSFSLKQLLQVVDPEHSYESLAIKHGLEAVVHYRTLQDEEEDKLKREALLSYCHMDTLAMVKVYEWCETLLKEGFDA